MDHQADILHVLCFFEAQQWHVRTVLLESVPISLHMRDLLLQKQSRNYQGKRFNWHGQLFCDSHKSPFTRSYDTLIYDNFKTCKRVRGPSITNCKIPNDFSGVSISSRKYQTYSSLDFCRPSQSYVPLHVRVYYAAGNSCPTSWRKTSRF